MFETRIMLAATDKVPLWDEDLNDAFVFFDRYLVQQRNYVAVLEEGRVVGLVGFTDTSRCPGSLSLRFLETHENHRRRGIAKLLVDGLFQFARRQGVAIANTEYEPDGLLWLKPLMTAAALRYPDVVLHEY